MDRQRFVDQVVLVTGSTSGLGRECALAFAREGAQVVVCGRREQQGLETVDMINAAGGKGLFLR